jgi:hypothetical protein
MVILSQEAKAFDDWGRILCLISTSHEDYQDTSLPLHIIAASDLHSLTDRPNAFFQTRVCLFIPLAKSVSYRILHTTTLPPRFLSRKEMRRQF